jgi:hypothetical protein
MCGVLTKYYPSEWPESTLPTTLLSMLRLALVTLLALACGSPNPAQTPSPTAEPNPTALPTSLPTGCHGIADATPGCTLSPESSYRELPGPNSQLQAGNYYVTGFTPKHNPVGFTVGEGWTTVQQFPGFFDIQDHPGSLDVVAVQWTIISEFDNADDAAADLEGRDNLLVSDEGAVTIDGLTGIRLVAETTDPPDADPVIFRPVLDSPAGPISIGSARHLQINLIATPDGVLAILVAGSVAEWDRALQLSKPVLDSVVIGD